MPQHTRRDNWILVAIANHFHVPFHDRRVLKLFLRLLRPWRQRSCDDKVYEEMGEAFERQVT